MKKINEMTKEDIIEALKDKGINHDKEATKAELYDLIVSRQRKLSMGNRTGSWYFGTKENTLAGKLCEAIALGKVKSTKDIRKQITSKYSFTETLKRLEVEGIIKRDGKQITLTMKGKEISAMSRASIANVA